MATKYVSSLAGGAGAGTFGSPWTIAQAVSSASASDEIRLLVDGTYATTSNIALTQNSTLLTGANASTGLVDGSLAVIQASGGASKAIDISGYDQSYQFLDVRCLAYGFYDDASGGSSANIYRCKISNYTSRGVNADGGFISVKWCELTGGTGSDISIWSAERSIAAYNYIHGSAGVGIRIDSYGSIVGNIISGVGSHGLQFLFRSMVENNTIYNSGGDGIRQTGTDNGQCTVSRNVLVSNGGYGLNNSAGTMGFTPTYDWNAYYNNFGATHNITAGPNDITLSGVPFTNAGGGDFSPNNTAGQGALLRAVAMAFAGGTTTSYQDIGAVQSSAAGGSTVIVIEE